jgi:hypothetical protein
MSEPEPQTPFQLDQGLFLETAETLLPWGASIDALRQLAPSSEVDRGYAIDLFWVNQVVLGGLAVNVGWDSNTPERFGMLLKDTNGQPAFEGYAVSLPKLVARLGQPHREWTDPEVYGAFPHAEWSFQQVTVYLSVWDRFGPVLGFSMYREAPKNRA